MTFYTRKGDDGTTGLYFGGRVRKDSDAPEAYGTVDEAQAAIGVARAESRAAAREAAARAAAEPGTAAGAAAHDGGAGEADADLDSILLEVERDLYVLMGELATLPENRHKLGDGVVTQQMVDRLERHTDALTSRFEMPKEFVLPGQNRSAAFLDHARTVVRRAERRCIPVAVADSHVIPYLNRLSSLLWAAARSEESASVPSKAKARRTD